MPRYTFSFLLVVVFMAAVGGCASRGLTPASGVVTTLPRLVRLSDASPLERFRTEDTDFNLSSRLSMGEDNTLYFGQLDTSDQNDKVTATSPVVVAKVNGRWEAISLADDRLPDAEFLFTAAGPAENEIWAVLDDQIADPADVVLLAHSIDAGRTWMLTTVRKPHGFGTYDSFAMDRSGRGRLTVYLTADEAKTRPGYYSFRTSDDGRTWTGPDYERDNLRTADDISDDDDPEPLQDLPPLRTAAAHNKGDLRQVTQVDHFYSFPAGQPMSH